MNISTGGLHILLFERDQQFATLLTSELQLASYTNHTARTAVEVFDAIARYPIRLVLVNLAQAAAARREFWVALDTQRRDRKVQVLTFLCTNLAGYGPRDIEDRSQSANADIEIDGMLGLMSLVEAVRIRVPSATTPVEPNSNTLPRLQRFSTGTSYPAVGQQQRPMQAMDNGIDSAFQAMLPADTGSLHAAPRSNTLPLPQTPLNHPTPSDVANYMNQNPAPSPATGMPSSNQPSYSEKIRAVLYPTQRTWNSQDTGGHISATDVHDHPFQPTQPTAYEAPTFQRTTTEPPAYDGQNESGLAQLSRMAQGFRTSSFKEENKSVPPQAQVQTPAQPTTQWTTVNTNTPSHFSYPPATPAIEPISQSQSYQQHQTQQYKSPLGNAAGTTSFNNAPAHTPTNYATLNTPTPTESQPEPITPPEPPAQPQMRTYSTFVIPTSRPTQDDEKIGGQPLRASPIQDMPIERTVTGPAITETPKRPDVLSRTNYAQSTGHHSAVSTNSHAAPATSAHLASFATPMPTPAKFPPAPEQPVAQRIEITIEQEKSQERQETHGTNQASRPKIETEPAATNTTLSGKEKINRAQTLFGLDENNPAQELQLPEDLAESMTANNAVLLDIVQSLPPMPALPQQPNSVQPQVLSGRATRALNKVLLDGHLVPQDRLEVAQNIQRMLRGVDLNYQLGEILLMFKLLTPDQLLAASLVSYGLITTTQISALGRIRQELHAIGLEYDLENLLILFRILTPEQLREVRSSLQN